MNLNEYQKEAEKTAIYPRRGQNITYPVLGLASEVGEVAGKLKKLERDSVTPDSFREDMKKEMGDALWYLAMCCSELRFTLEEVAIANVAKLEDRARRGVLKGNGDNR